MKPEDAENAFEAKELKSDSNSINHYWINTKSGTVRKHPQNWKFRKTGNSTKSVKIALSKHGYLGSVGIFTTKIILKSKFSSATGLFLKATLKWLAQK